MDDTKLARVGAVVFQRCVAILGDREAARDVTQEVLVKLWQHQRDLRDPAAWAWRVATNACLNRIHKDRRLVFRAPEQVPDPGRAPKLDERLDAHQELARVWDRLGARDRRVFQLVFVDELDQGQAARVLDVSRRTVLRAVGRIRRVAFQGEGGRT
jgi:RNA polymerase sigma-70 factor, ECF subfamily